MKDLGANADSVVLYFKERIYATFTGLAIVLVATVSDHPTPAHSALLLVLGVLGITAARRAGPARGAAADARPQRRET
ncbi:hypothetical protein [Microbacterium pygmaeum]|uniref:hypothetical protein n=1 Tax=Microbacterium pygmaeum TaxID=370764 RepID=UPI0012FC2481|nr:hypothetical protein [Microbacterium pygmaeum]